MNSALDSARTYRPPRFYLIVGIAGLAAVAAIAITGRIATFQVPGTFAVSVASVAILAAFAAFSLWLVAAYFRESLTVSRSTLVQRRVVGSTTLEFSDVTSAEWRFQSGACSILLRSDGSKARISVGAFTADEQSELVGLLREAIASDLQHGWDGQFAPIANPETAHQRAKRVRASFLLVVALAGCGALCIYALIEIGIDLKWMAPAFLLGTTALWQLWPGRSTSGRTKPRSVPGQCKQCHYILGGVVVCPECGLPDATACLERGRAAFERGEHDEAIAYFDKAIRADPTDGGSFTSRGAAWWAKKEYAKALADFEDALRAAPSSPEAFTNRGLAWCKSQEFGKALADYSEAIRLYSERATAWVNRGFVRHDWRDYDGAIADYVEAGRSDPQLAVVFTCRADTWLHLGHTDRAFADYDEAIRLDPQSATAFVNRGMAWHFNKAYERAIADYDAAILLEPKMEAALQCKAWLLATCAKDEHRDVTKAKELMKAVQQLRPSNPSDESTLAAIAAAEGRFGDAVAIQTKALEDHGYPRNEDPDVAERIAAYAAKRPWRV